MHSAILHSLATPDLIRKSKAYLQYLTSSKKKHGTHSPFVFELLDEVFAHKQFYCFEDIEDLRSELLTVDHEIEITDLGAGSKTTKASSRKIKDIVKTASKQKKYGQLLFRIIHHLRYKSILELGTNLGMTTAYLSKATSGEVTTIEGCPNLCEAFIQHMQILELDNVTIINQNFDHVLDKLSQNKYDLIFIDGNHRGDALIRYTKTLLPSLTENGMMVIDDINWSGDMNEAYVELSQLSDFNITIDLFEMALLFKAPGTQKQNFVIRY